MERTVLTLSAFFLFLTLQAQWTLSPEGMTSDSEVIIEAEGDQSQLYQQVKDYLYTLYQSPKEVLSENEPTSIRIAGKESQAIHRNSMHVFDIKYSLLIEFKEDRMRISPPSFKLTTTSAGQFQTLHLVYGGDLTGTDLGIYNPTGKLKSKRAKADLEAFFNGWTARLQDALKEQTPW